MQVDREAAQEDAGGCARTSTHTTSTHHACVVHFAAASSQQPSDGNSATDAVRAQLQAKEQEVDRLEEKFIEVEERVAELEGEKQQQLDANA